MKLTAHKKKMTSAIDICSLADNWGKQEDGQGLLHWRSMVSDAPLCRAPCLFCWAVDVFIKGGMWKLILDM